MNWWLALALLVPAASSWAQGSAAPPAAPTQEDVAHVTQVAQLYARVQGDSERTREDVRALAAELHPTVAKYLVVEIRAQLSSAVVKQRRFARFVFPCIKDAGDWQQMPEEELLVSALAMDLDGIKFPAYMKFRTDYVGIVPEGNQLLHVLQRSSWVDLPAPQGQPEEFTENGVSVVTFKRSGEAWKLLTGNPDFGLFIASRHFDDYGLGKAAVSNWCPARAPK